MWLQDYSNIWPPERIFVLRLSARDAAAGLGRETVLRFQRGLTMAEGRFPARLWTRAPEELIRARHIELTVQQTTQAAFCVRQWTHVVRLRCALKCL